MVCDSWVASVPSMDKTMALVMLIINIFFPGFGTIIGALVGKTSEVGLQIVIGIIQLLTAWLLIGWIWAIWWGIIMVQKAG